jgi:hypothetical protein
MSTIHKLIRHHINLLKTVTLPRTLLHTHTHTNVLIRYSHVSHGAFLWHNSPGTPYYRDFTISLRHITSVGLLSTSDQPDARDLYPKTPNTHKRQTTYYLSKRAAFNRVPLWPVTANLLGRILTSWPKLIYVQTYHLRRNNNDFKDYIPAASIIFVCFKYLF